MINNIVFKKIGNKDDYLAVSSKSNLPLTQSYFYGRWHENFGRKICRYSIYRDDSLVGFFQGIKFDIGFNKNYWYIPHGPILLIEPDEGFWFNFRNKLKQNLFDENTIFLRFDPVIGDFVSDFSRSANYPKDFLNSSRRSYYSNFQPKFEWIVDVRSEEKLLKNKLHRTAKYLIGLATRKGITIEIVEKDIEKYFDVFFQMMVETGTRDGFSLHPRDYYMGVFRICAQEGSSFLVVGRLGEDIVLVNLIVMHGNMATFVFGGSKSSQLKHGLSYLAHWSSMLEVKRRGYIWYNFGAVILENLKASYSTYRRWIGFSGFKQKFGGQVLEYNNFCDIVLKYFWYKIFNVKRQIDLWLKF